ncbi:MAG: hypothetical protein H7X85_08940 [Thermoanaerobaculia bacterium]|nr:hypothetical protein [Thermoanaerobaculia bacterium]
MRPSKLKRMMLTGAMVSLMSFSAAYGAERTSSRVSRPNAQETGRVVPFRSDKTDSWMCNNVSSFWCQEGRATQAPPPSTNRGRGRG